MMESYPESCKIALVTTSNVDVTQMENLVADLPFELHIFSNSFTPLQLLKEDQKILWALLISDQAKPLTIYQLEEYCADHDINNVLFFSITDNIKNQELDKTSRSTFIFIESPLTKKSMDIIEKAITNKIQLDTKDSEGMGTDILFSLDYLEGITGGNKELIKEALQTFIDSVGKQLPEMEILAQTNSEKGVLEIREIAHSIKPSFEMIQNEKGKSICDDLCYRTDESQILPKITELHEEYVGLKKKLQYLIQVF